MIDYIKIEAFNVNLSSLSNKKEIEDPSTKLGISTGEVSGGFKAKYKNLTIKLTDKGRLFIGGSLHNFFNYNTDSGKGYNHGDFTINNVKSVITELSQTFGVPPQNFRILNIEFGVNIPYPIFLKTNISELLINHKDKSFRDLNNKAHSRIIGRVAHHTQYDIKIYEKGKQYKLDVNELRVEIKVEKMEFLTRGLKEHEFQFASKSYLSLADLLKKETVNHMESILCRVWSEILIFDNTVDESSLSTEDTLFLSNSRNPIYWVIKNFSKHELTNAKNKYNRIVIQNSRVHYHDKILKLIKLKWNELSNTENVATMGNNSGNKMKISHFILTLFDHLINRVIIQLISWFRKRFSFLSSRLTQLLT